MITASLSCTVCATPLSRTAIWRAANGLRKMTGLCGTCHTASIKKDRSCCECGAKLARTNAKRCQPCNNRRMASDKDREARRIANSQVAFQRPDIREKHIRAMTARRLAWLPEEYRDEYRRLQKHISQPEAKAAILAQMTPFERQMARVAAGARLVEAFRPVRADPSFTLGGVTGSWG